MRAKAALRRALACARKQVGDLSSTAVCAAVTLLPEWHAAPCVACYCAMTHELDVRALLAGAFASGKHVLLPRVTGPHAGDMTFLLAASLDDIAAFPADNRYRIPEPPALWQPPGGGAVEARPEWSAASTPLPTLVLVPGVAFSSDGSRLGHGKGYYDFWLARLFAETSARRAPPPLLVGICLNSALVDGAAIPMGPTDVRVHVVCTPTVTIRCTHPPPGSDAM